MINNVLWVDDIRDPAKYINEKHVHWAKSYREAVSAIQNNYFTHISLDNDLGDVTEKQGRHLLNYIEELLEEHHPCVSSLTVILIHTSNPVAAREMLSVKNNFYHKYGVVVDKL